jgi:hypothetical protein
VKRQRSPAAQGREYSPAWREVNVAAVTLFLTALNLNQVFSPEKTTPEHLSAIDSTVAIVKARIEPAMAS